MEGRKLIKENDIVGFRVKYNNTWYGIFVETAIKYGVYNRLYSVSSKMVKLLSQQDIPYLQFGIEYDNFKELDRLQLVGQIF